MSQVSAERDLSKEANMALKAELERFRHVTGNTVEALEREKAVKAQLENQNKAQASSTILAKLLVQCRLYNPTQSTLSQYLALHSSWV